MLRALRCCPLLFVCAFVVLDAVWESGCSWASAKTASPRPAGTPTASVRQLTLDVAEPNGVARLHWPVTTGVPFPPGAVTDATVLVATAGGRRLPLQRRTLSRWPDGSVRWALLDFQVDLSARQKRRIVIHPGAPPSAATGVKVTDAADAVTVDTGPLRFRVPKRRFALMADVNVGEHPVVAGGIGSFFDVDGTRLEAAAPDTVTITEAGPLRARIELRGRYAERFEYVVRIDAFAGQPFVRVLHTFEQHSSEPYTTVRQIGIQVPLSFEGTASYIVGQGERRPLAGPLPARGFTLVQEDNEQLVVDGSRRAGRAPGWAALRDATHGVAVAARFFWQEYPQGFELRRSGITYNLWAPQAPPARVGMGAAKTHEMVLYFSGKTPPPAAVLATLAEPLLARVNPQWIVASGALRNSIAPTAPAAGFLRALHEGFRRYQRQNERERWDDSGEIRCPPRTPATPAASTPPERPRHGAFGMFNWGDWNFPGYHDTTKGCDAWGNLEYDTTQVLALAYAATGERAYHEAMIAAARHFMDVDRIYYQRDRPTWIGMNHPKNPLHFTFALGGVDLGHTWTEGLLSYYYFTGDDRGLEAARGIAAYLVRRVRGTAVRGNPRQWGWPQIALVAAYEATGDPTYKSAAAEYARGGMAAHAPAKLAGWKLGILADGLSYTHSVTHDPRIRDWLQRYAKTVRTDERGARLDPRFLPAMAYVGRLDSDAQDLSLAAAAVPRLRFGSWGKPFTIAGRIGFRILSLLAPATPTEGGAVHRSSSAYAARARASAK